MVPLCLAVISLCMVAVTLTIVMTAYELRRTLRNLNGILPEAHRSLHRINRVLARVDAAGRSMETVVHQLCDTALGVLRRLASFGASATSLWVNRVGNGAGEEPRRRHRSG